MPRVETDEALLREVRRYVESAGGVTKAARALGMDRSTLWRYLQSGSAIERNRAKLRQVARSQENETTAQESATNEQLPAASLAGCSIDELRKVRSMCRQAVMVIDWYEAHIAEAEIAANAAAGSV